MEKEDIKKKLHEMIDAIESEEKLETIMMFMEPEIVYQTTDWLDKLSEADLARLNKSIEQAERGEFIDHETIKAKYAEWLK
jgi:hypothetical protein